MIRLGYCFCILLFITSFSFAKAESENFGTVEIIDVKELAKIINQVLIVDARQSKFIDGHIPNSQNMDWENWTEEKPGLTNAIFGHPEKWGRVITGDQVQIRLRQLGLSHTKKIVVVGDPSGWGEDGRIAWNLLYWGTEHVALLDGGYPAWVKAGYAIEKGRSKPIKTGDFIYTLKPQRRATLDDLKGNAKFNSRLILDVRTAKEFEGQTMPGQKRGGRIPKAKLIEFEKLYESDGRFISGERLKKLLTDAAEKKPITYCTGGVRSALLALLIEARFGILTANYDASIWEWSSHSELPLEKGLGR